MPLTDDIRTLRLLVEKADKLAGFSFTKYMMNGGRLGLTATRSDDGTVTYSTTGYDAEGIDAFLLTLRMFVQKKDAICFDNIEKIFDRLGIDPQRIIAVKDTQQEIKKRLDEKTVIVVDGKSLIRREVFNIVLYGSLAHTNDDKLPTFDAWMSRPGLREAVLMEFALILGDLYQAVLWFRNACQAAADIVEQAATKPGP